MNKHYYNRYLKLINHYQLITVIGQIETHHILPKSMGGSNSKENLVDLPLRVHYIAHYLLWKAYGNKETQRAFWCMNTNNKGHFNSRLYTKIRETVINSMLGKNNHRYGKHWSKKWKDAQRKRIGNRYAGKNNPMYGRCETGKLARRYDHIIYKFYNVIDDIHREYTRGELYTEFKLDRGSVGRLVNRERDMVRGWIVL